MKPKMSGHTTEIINFLLLKRGFLDVLRSRAEILKIKDSKFLFSI